MPKDYAEINERLAGEFSRPPYVEWKDWTFDFEYPGFFVYYHKTLPYRIYFTPGWSKENEIAIQIQHDSGDTVEVEDVPFFTDKAEDLHAIIIQWLEFIEANVRERPGRGVLDWFPEEKEKLKPWKPRPK